MNWVLLSIVLPLVMSLVGRQLWEFLPSISRAILANAAKLLPREERERYAEEWEADLANVPGALAQFFWSLGCVTVASRRALVLGLRASRPPALPPPIVVAPAAALAWPWTPQPAEAEVRVQGDTNAAIRLGVARDTAQLAWLSQLLAAGAGQDTSVVVTWTSDGANACRMVAVGGSYSHDLRFIRTDDGRLAVDFGHFFTNRREAGLSKVAFRNALSVFDEAGVKYVVAHTGDAAGGLLWAKLGAVPIDAPMTRERLFQRISKSLSDGNMSADVAMFCWKVVADAPNGELMLRLSCLSDEERKIGPELLMGFEWEAFTDLSDDDQRRSLIAALG